MKICRIVTAIVFSLLVLLPILTFNFQPNVVSEIDNRKLAESPFDGDDLTQGIENYLNDRIGLRDQMILGYTVLNDRLFGEMVHPSYVYGKDGYVFGAGITVWDEYREFHTAFADMVLACQTYCESRGIPFLFVFNPAKPAVLTEYLPAGVNYNRSWVDLFFEALDERGVSYLDNTALLRQKTEAGEVVYNRQYDANHWNDLGAYYGTVQILETLQKRLPTVHVNAWEELTVDSRVETSLPVSLFPIHEEVPVITLSSAATDRTADYEKEVTRHPSYPAFGYYQNAERAAEGAPSALVFQGSYMNGMGYKYLPNAFSEYVYVHDYQNVMDIDYYVNIFDPDVVVFEVAEYTFSETYFSLDRMKGFTLPTALPEAEKTVTATQSKPLSERDVTVSHGERLSTFTWNQAPDGGEAWMLLDGRVLDLRATETDYRVTVDRDDVGEAPFSIVHIKDGIKTIYQ